MIFTLANKWGASQFWGKPHLHMGPLLGNPPPRGMVTFLPIFGIAQTVLFEAWEKQVQRENPREETFQ